MAAPVAGSATPVRAQGDAGRIWLTTSSLALAAIFAVYALRLLVSDRALAIASTDPTATAALATVLRWEPSGAASDLAYSRAMASLAAGSSIFRTKILARQQALDAAVRATRTAEDRQNAWYNLAVLLAQQGDAGGVERSLRRSIACAPNWFKPHWTLAQLLEVSGRHAEALKEAEIAIQTNGGKFKEVNETWLKLRAH